jgi:serine/threonine-protein kinase
MHPADPRVALLRDHLVGHVLSGTDGIRFHLRQLIGEGGQGWIYKGNYDEPDGVPIVIKVLRPDRVTDETLAAFSLKRRCCDSLALRRQTRTSSGSTITESCT